MEVTLINFEAQSLSVGTTFIRAEPGKGDLERLKFLWWPAAIAEFSECSGRRDKFLIDCYVPASTGFSIARFLLIRKLPRNVAIDPSPTVSAPIISGVDQGVSALMSDARKTWEVLNDRDRVVDELIRQVPERYYEPVYRRNVLRFPFVDPKVRVKERILRTNAEILKSIVRNLCLDRGVLPTRWDPVHVLVGLDMPKEEAYLFIGRSRIKSRALSLYVFRTSLKDRVSEYLRYC